MQREGITNPDSKEGILFCAGNKRNESRCPYPYCVVVENKKLIADNVKPSLIAYRMHNKGICIEDIALILEKNERTVVRWIRYERTLEKDSPKNNL